MDPKAIDQIHLCLNELQMVKQLLDLEVADDFCSRVLGIYAMMRVDDVTKIWSHNIPKKDANRPKIDTIKDQYNDGLRNVRDKLGAHYQSPSDEVDLFGSVLIFKNLDYANTLCLIDDIISVETQLEGVSVQPKGFDDVDLGTAKGVLESMYSDDQAYITNGALDVFGINKGGLMTCGSPQVKGQYLRSIELMVETAQRLLDESYQAKEVERIFKRLYVCMIYNYHDNLITRKDISDTAVQYEEGFDKLFLQHITDRDNRGELETAFDKFEAIYKVESVIKKNRKVRDHACAHLDEKSTVVDINKKLDTLDICLLSKTYQDMLDMFNYICSSVFLLTPLVLPPRVPLYGAFVETVGYIENFYGKKPYGNLSESMTVTEIMRSIRRCDNRYEEACETLEKRLMSEEETIYQQMVNALAQRLREPLATDNEMAVIIRSLSKAKRGDPLRLQRTLVAMMNDQDIFKYHNGHLLFLLSTMCREDDKIDMHKLLDSIIRQKHIVPTALSMLALLHMTVEKMHSCFVNKNKAHDVTEEFKSYCDSVSHPTEKCAMMLVLCQHWLFNMEFAFYRGYESKYTAFLLSETEKAFNSYVKYAKIDEKELDCCKKYLETRHHLLLLYRLAVAEKERNQRPNVFLEMWKYNCFFRTKIDIYEAFGVGLMDELEGDEISARKIFECLRKENPINEDAIITLNDFYKRHSGLKNE